MALILILDDEQPLLQSLSLELKRNGHQCLVAETGREAQELLDKQSPDLAVLDVQLPDVSGIDVLRRLRSELPEVPVLMITAYASVDSAVEAMKEGAIDYLEKPLDLEEFLLVVERELANSRLRSEVEAFRREQIARETRVEVIGDSPAIQHVREMVESLSTLPLDKAEDLPTILIEGETGVGKDIFARLIHFSGPLRERPFVRVNCSSLPRELVESELFGHEKGAFTGARDRKQGLFEVAHGGTIFLDEIGDMAMDIQAKLLTVLESKKARRVGGTREYPVDSRIIAATNKDLPRAIENGEFRSDLYYRLKVVQLALPPLRQRREDVAPLARHFFELFKKKYRKPDLVLDDSVLSDLSSRPWPGNVRELAHTLEHMVLMAQGNQVGANLSGDGNASPSSVAGRFDFSEGKCTLEAVEKELIEAALRHAGGNVSEVARLLGLTRGALRHRMEKWEIHP